MIFRATAQGRFTGAGLDVRCALGPGGVIAPADKLEGDGRSPAGVWPLRRVLYRPDRLEAPRTGLSVTPLTPDDGWCDAPADPNYNRFVKRPYSASAERLWREDGVYDIIVILGFNDEPVIAGKGSAIFWHLAREDYQPTQGCIAIARADMLTALAAANPGGRIGDHKMKRVGTIFLAAMLLAAPARANDTSAALETGGLKFKRTSAIEMVSEDLFISMKEVKVHYVFRNKTNKDVTTPVAFPLPDMKADMQESPLNIPNGMSPNFIDFKTSVDSKPVTLSIEQKAVQKGRDVTPALIAQGAPLNPLDPTFSNKIAHLPKANLDALVKAKLVYADQIDQGKGWEPYYRPSWDLKTSYYREQTFPSGKDVVVDHSYRPIVGGTVAVMARGEFWGNYVKQYHRDYCVDADFEVAAKKLPENAQERWINYVLKTGANWAGPIGSFRLVVDKGAPANLVSFCGTGVTKLSPTQFEMKATKFKPAKDLHILIAEPNPQ